jgi:hypothetical protein
MMEDEGWYVHILENLFPPLEKRYLKIPDVWSSNPCLGEYPSCDALKIYQTKLRAKIFRSKT